MRRLLAALAALILVAAPLAAQGLDEDGPRADELRQRIEERFAARVQEDLGLNDEQSAKMQVTLRNFFVKRHDLEADDRRFREALAGQLRPGVAANQDSVARLTEALLDLKIKYAQSYREEMKEMSAYLNPVQRAQFLILRERLLERVRQAKEGLRQGGEGAPRRRLRP